MPGKISRRLRHLMQLDDAIPPITNIANTNRPTSLSVIFPFAVTSSLSDAHPADPANAARTSPFCRLRNGLESMISSKSLTSGQLPSVFLGGGFILPSATGVAGYDMRLERETLSFTGIIFFFGHPLVPKREE